MRLSNNDWNLLLIRGQSAVDNKILALFTVGEGNHRINDAFHYSFDQNAINNFALRPFVLNLNWTCYLWLIDYWFIDFDWYLLIVCLFPAWHNYHHCFPWDYKTSELPFYTFNASTAFIDFFAWLGWATDLKTVPQEMIRDRARRTGDGSHPVAQSSTNYSSKRADGKAEIDGKVASWGWGDKDMAEEAIRVTKLMRL